MKRIFIDKDMCQGCLTCSVACMAEHNPAGKSVYSLELASPDNTLYNNVLADADGRPVPVFCRHCDDPDCVRACMSGAMAKDPETGRVLHDSDRCGHCFMCVMACPHGVLKVNTGTGQDVQKCDYCGNREIPRCVQECPSGALDYRETEGLSCGM